MNLFGIRQLADFLGVSQASVRRWLKSGTFPQRLHISTRRIAGQPEAIVRWLGGGSCRPNIDRDGAASDLSFCSQLTAPGARSRRSAAPRIPEHPWCACRRQRQRLAGQRNRLFRPAHLPGPYPLPERACCGNPGASRPLKRNRLFRRSHARPRQQREHYPPRLVGSRHLADRGGGNQLTPPRANSCVELLEPVHIAPRPSSPRPCLNPPRPLSHTDKGPSSCRILAPAQTGTLPAASSEGLLVRRLHFCSR
jgi:predicted DNA-binding transcriptional regulator AlpA